MKLRNHHEADILTGREPEHVSRFDALVEYTILQDAARLTELAQQNQDLHTTFGEDRRYGYCVGFSFKNDSAIGKGLAWYNEAVASHRIVFTINDEGDLVRSIKMLKKQAGGCIEKTIGSNLGLDAGKAFVDCLSEQPDRLAEVVSELCMLSDRDVSRVASAHHAIKARAGSSNGHLHLVTD